MFIVGHVVRFICCKSFMIYLWYTPFADYRHVKPSLNVAARLTCLNLIDKCVVVVLFPEWCVMLLIVGPYLTYFFCNHSEHLTMLLTLTAR